MKKNDNTGFGLIKAVCERAQNNDSSFCSALKKLTNSSEEDLKTFLEMRSANKYLKRIDADRVFKINACDGTRTISNSKNVFKGGIYLNGISLSPSCPKTERIKVVWDELIKNANYRTMFSSFCKDINKPKEIMFTQSQVVDFCEKYLLNALNLLSGIIISIPFEDNDKYFVAYVRVLSDGLYVHIYHFVFSPVWPACYSHRLVVPAS